MPPPDVTRDSSQIFRSSGQRAQAYSRLPLSTSRFCELRENLTAERVATYFAPLGPTKVERYEAANVLGLNFLLRDALAGGASRSLRIDTQGKTYGLALLQMVVELPEEHLSMCRPRSPGE